MVKTAKNLAAIAAAFFLAASITAAAATTVTAAAAAKETVIPSSKITFNNGKMPGLKIVSAKTSGKKLIVTYSASEAYGTTKFSFTATDKSNKKLGSWSNTELITKPRAGSTWNFSASYAEKIDKVSITAENKKWAEKQAVLDGILAAANKLADLAATLDDLDIATGVLAKVTGTASAVKKVQSAVTLIRNFKGVAEVGKKYKAATTEAEKQRHRAELASKNLDFLGNLGGLGMNAIQSKLLDCAVTLAKGAVKAMNDRAVFYNWVSDVGLYDTELLEDQYKNYRSIGGEMWEKLPGSGDDKSAKILKTFKALKKLETAK
jgi:hypothetical protein